MMCIAFWPIATGSRLCGASRRCPREAIVALAEVMARRLSARIGGRYVPKRDDRALRDAAVRAAFTERNFTEAATRGQGRGLIWIPGKITNRPQCRS